jgi:hypothetical protein
LGYPTAALATPTGALDLGHNYSAFFSVAFAELTSFIHGRGKLRVIQQSTAHNAGEQPLPDSGRNKIRRHIYL